MTLFSYLRTAAVGTEQTENGRLDEAKSNARVVLGTGRQTVVFV